MSTTWHFYSAKQSKDRELFQYQYFPGPPNAISRTFKDQSHFPGLSGSGNLTKTSNTFKEFPWGVVKHYDQTCNYNTVLWAKLPTADKCWRLVHITKHAMCATCLGRFFEVWLLAVVPIVVRLITPVSSLSFDIQGRQKRVGTVDPTYNAVNSQDRQVL